jgi:hypothetical protein
MAESVLFVRCNAPSSANRRPPMSKEWRPADWILKRVRQLNSWVANTVGREANTVDFIGGYEAGASAMLEARDKDWIAWMNDICPHDIHGQTTKMYCPECVAARKKEITHDR